MSKAGATKCIICGENRPGLPVRNDNVIEAIRWFKKNVTKDERGYPLVVCKDCYQAYAKARKRYEGRQIIYLVIGFVFAGLMVYASTNKGIAILYGIGIIVFMYLLSLLTYIPALNTSETSPGPGKLARQRAV